MNNDNDNKEKKLKIAIIGAGISGAACSFFLRQTLKDNCEISVFERSNRIGGRLATIEFEGRNFELGGSILHPSNLYMKGFMKILGLEKSEDADADEYLGLFDSKGLIIEKKGEYYGLIDKWNFIKHFGLFQLIKFDRWVENFVGQFSKIYKLQDKGHTFTSTEQFLKTVSARLYKASQESLRNILEREKFNDKIINELASIATLANYGQKVDINGFVGLVSLAGCTADLFSIKNGNKQVPEELFKISNVNLILNATVKAVSKDPNEPDSKNLVSYKLADSDEIKNESFDYVVVGFPLYKNVINESYFKLDFDSKIEFDDLEMQLTNTYFIYGKVKLFKNLPVDKYIQLHSVDPDIPYRTICVNLPCDYSKIKDKYLFKKSGHQVYKIFAEQNLDEKTFGKIFENDYVLITEMPWLAYPKYKNTEPNLDVVLDGLDRSRVFYANSFEWTSSCMEICSIGSRNVSNLIAKKEADLVKGKFSITEIKFKDQSKFGKLLHKLCGMATLFSLFVFVISYYWSN